MGRWNWSEKGGWRGRLEGFRTPEGTRSERFDIYMTIQALECGLYSVSCSFAKVGPCSPSIISLTATLDEASRPESRLLTLTHLT